MPASLQVTKAAVRRFLLACQGLGPGLAPPSQAPVQARSRSSNAPTPAVLACIKALECVQLDPVAAVERNQHLVLAARMSGYTPAMLEQLLEQGDVFEYWANAACVMPMQDYPLFELRRRRLRVQLQPELDQLGEIVDAVLHRLEADGPLPSKAFKSADKVHGYWDNTHAKTKATSHALNLLHDTGRIQVVRREGTTRYFDIRERAVPTDVLDDAVHISDAEAHTALVDKYMRAYRVFDAGDSRFGWQRLSAAERRQTIDRYVNAGLVVPLDIAEVQRQYFVLAQDVERLQADMHDDGGRHGGCMPPQRTGHALFLPPLDNLMWRRDRVEDFFGFSYAWEIYIPAAKRRFGYYTMPILVGDRMVGRIDPRLNRDAQTLAIRLLQLEPGVRLTKALRAQIMRGLQVFAKFHGATVGEIEGMGRRDTE